MDETHLPVKLRRFLRRQRRHSVPTEVETTGMGYMVTIPGEFVAWFNPVGELIRTRAFAKRDARLVAFRQEEEDSVRPSDGPHAKAESV